MKRPDWTHRHLFELEEREMLTAEMITKREDYDDCPEQEKDDRDYLVRLGRAIDYLEERGSREAVAR
jgi:hypothetical protein